MVHENKDLEHYHLRVVRDYYKYSAIDIPELFKTTNKDRGVIAATVADIYVYIYDNYGNDEVVKSGDFYLSWKGYRLDPSLEIANIEVDGEKIKLYVIDVKNPITIKGTLVPF